MACRCAHSHEIPQFLYMLDTLRGIGGTGVEAHRTDAALGAAIKSVSGVLAEFLQ